MDSDSRLYLFISIILLFVAMFFAITEISFSASSRTRLKVMSDSGNKKAGKALFILDNFDRAITTILIGTNIVHLSIAALVTLAVTRIWGISFVSIGTIITTMVIFMFGEMLPKSIAKKYPEDIALFCAPTLRFLMSVLSPLSGLLSAIGNLFSKLIKGEPELTVTEDEIYDIIEDMTEDGTLDEDQGELISSALQFGDLTAESVLTPRMDVVAIDVNDDIEDILAIIKSCTHSRLPVYDGSIDNIVGILKIRTFIKQYIKDGKNLDLKGVLDEPYFVYQGVFVDELLPLMSRNKINIAIVTDNYGGTLGIVTIEDILEELVGEIWDEEDVVKDGIREVSPDVFSVEADERVSDVFEAMGIDVVDSELVDKVMGTWAYENFGFIPKVGESFRYPPLKISVSKMDHNRIIQLDVEKEGEGNE